MNGNYEEDKSKRKVVFAIPPYPLRPYQQTVDSLRDEVPLIEAAGWEHGVVAEIGNPYISAARAVMLRKALDAKATHIVFLDHDVSWKPGDLLKLIETEGDVVAGTYRFKKDEEVYMGAVNTGPGGSPLVRESDGALSATAIPAGFLRITRAAVNRFMEAYPELCYGEYCSPHVDLFNHGAHNRLWFGEDYAFARNWIDAGGQIWLVPDLDITHWLGETPYHGNFHKFLLKQPGGSDSANPVSPEERKAQLLAKLAALKPPA
jgi:hypothetical protein